MQKEKEEETERERKRIATDVYIQSNERKKFINFLFQRLFVHPMKFFVDEELVFSNQL